MVRSRFAIVLGALFLAAIPAAVDAQGTGRGFLFREPRVSLTMRTGWAGASAGSDLFSFTTGQLTLDRGDFSSLTGGAELGIRLLDRTHLALSVGVASARRKSEFRDYYDNNELPIEQTTTFVRAPITLGLKYYVMPAGRAIGKFAWIPAKFAPYAGVGGGLMYYRFRQAGDFVDFESLDVFTSQFVSDGWASTAHVRGGVDYSLGARVALTLETRYNWSKTDLSRDFVDFGALDLSGLATTVGLTLRF